MIWARLFPCGQQARESREACQHERRDHLPGAPSTRRALFGELSKWLRLGRPIHLASYTTIHAGQRQLGKSPRDHGYHLSYGSDGASVSTARLMDRAIETVIIEEGPFLHLNWPTDLSASAGAIEAFDAELGRLLATLEEKWIDGASTASQSDALVILTSDGGEGPAVEKGVAVKWIVRWRGHIRPGVNATPVRHVDLLPTLAALASIPIPESVQLDGVDLTQLWLQRTPPRR